MNTKNAEAMKDAAFKKINECLMELDQKTGSNIESTQHIFDVMEEIMARIIAGSSNSPENLEQIEKGVSERVLMMAKKFAEMEK